MDSKKSFWLSSIAIVLSFVSFAHSFLVTEFGVLFGSGDYDLHVEEYIRIFNAESLALEPTILVHNNGTRPLRIKKVAALLQLKAENHVFLSNFTINMQPQSILSGPIRLDEDLLYEEVRKRDELSMDITNYIIEKYKILKTKNVQVMLSQDLLSRIKNVQNSNVSWMKEDENYYLLLLFWLNEDDRIPSEIKLFKFKFSAFHRTLLTDYQFRASETPRADLVPANLSVTFFARTRMEIIDDPEQRARKYTEYEKLAK